MLWLVIVAVVLVGVLFVAVYDMTQRKHAILRNFPLIGHLRYLLEKVGPELRQYIVTSNDEERPFSRDQRRWVYASSKRENSSFGFGSDNEFQTPGPGHLFIKHSAFPHPPVPADDDDLHPIAAAKVLGAAHGRTHAVRPPSIVNISGMSFGALSGAAIEAMNRGAAKAGTWQSTGEGGLSPHHQHGGELIFQIGTSYFGVRDGEGRFEMSRLIDLCAANPVRAIELKLSQGAKPGAGALLPAAKVTAEISKARGIPQGKDCHSPAYHTAFDGVDGLIDFCERIAEVTGLPVGVKSAVGMESFWVDLATRMAVQNAGPDLVVIDGGEGGTGAGPLVFTDHVALPFRIGFPRVYRAFAEAGLRDDVVFAGSGKLGFPAEALHALAMGCDLVHVAREPMLAVGCIQAQRCHTGHCPTGVATQSKWLTRGLDPTSKADRCANYLTVMRKELLQLAHACGYVHPAEVPLNQLEFIVGPGEGRTAADLVGYPDDWGLPRSSDLEAVREVTIRGR